jgi:SNF2 family DNA or RNA helicase
MMTTTITIENDSFWKTKNMNDLVTMIRAKQLCILPKLLEKTVQQLELDEPDDLFPEGFKHTTFQNTSCKLNAIIQHILSPKRQGRGKIIFCHFQLEMTKIIEFLRENESNYWIGNWKEFTKRKCTKTPILILQIRSGCEGLNLQNEFSDVYFVSPNWNPTLEDQAIARCHRIGQQKKVFVYRFYMDSLLSNSEKIAENKNKKNIVYYFNIYNNIPDDLKRYIDSFLLDDFIPTIKRSTTMKYSMDLYTLMKQNEKREKINEFMNRITI